MSQDTVHPKVTEKLEAANEVIDAILAVDTDIRESIESSIEDMLAKLTEAQASGDTAAMVALLAQSHANTEADATKRRSAKAEAVKAEAVKMDTDAKVLIDALTPEFFKVYQAENVEQMVLKLAEVDSRISGFCYIAEVTRTPATTVTAEDGTVTETPASVSISQPHGTLHKFVKRGATRSTSANTTGESTGQGAAKAMTVNINGVEKIYPNAQEAKRELLSKDTGMSRANVVKGIDALDGHQVVNP
jgi:hypothetical protein